MYDDAEIKQFADIVKSCESIVFFGGAGVSTASGIPDFRGANGLYVGTSAEDMIHIQFFRKHPDEFYRFYKEQMLFPEARPNIVHEALAVLEQQGKLAGVITQNIDGLHQLAGSKNVVELHGTVHRNFCTRCGKQFDLDYVVKADGVPYCDKCGGIVKPDVVLYGESLSGSALWQAEELVENSDLLIVGGTSLKVFPAAGYVANYQGDNLVIINRDPTPYDGSASLVLHCDLEDAFAWVLDDK